MQTFENDVVQATNAIAQRTISIKRAILDFFITILDRHPELATDNAPFIESWTRSVPTSRGLDEAILRLAATTGGSKDKVEEEEKCPICEEVLVAHSGDNGVNAEGEFRCSMWHIWSESNLHHASNVSTLTSDICCRAM